jgi:DNA modification methylase
MRDQKTSELAENVDAHSLQRLVSQPFYDADGITIYYGDCFQILKALTEVDIVVTSPPYNTLPTSGKASGLHAERKTGKNLWLERAADGYDEYGKDELGYQIWLEQILMRCSEIAKGIVWVNHKTRYRDGIAVHPLNFLRGLPLTHEIIWDRGISMALNAKRYAPSHEYIFGFGRAHYWNDALNTKMSVWRQPPCVNRNADGHPCPYPEEIVSPLIQSSCPPGGIVLDPFCGSGTTLRVAKDLGMRAIGIEKEKRYCQLAAERMSQGVLGLANAGTERQRPTER